MPVIRLVTRAAVVAALICLPLLAAGPAFAAPGDVLFSAPFHASAAAGYDKGAAIAVDTLGRPAAAGFGASLTAGVDSAFTVALDPLGVTRWALPWNATGSARLVDVAVGAGDSVLAVGSTGSAANGDDLLVLDYGADGSLPWSQTYDGPGHGDDEASAVVTGDDGSVYVTGMSAAADGDQDVVTIKYAADGTRLWTRRYNSPWDAFDRGMSLYLRGANLFVAGISHHPGHNDDVVLIRYTSGAGTRKWVRFFDDAKGGDETVAAVVASSTTVYVCGSGKNGSAAGGDALLLKYSLAGSLQWTQWVGGSRGGFDSWTGMALAPGSAPTVTGYVYRTATGDDLIVTRYRPDGTRRWQWTMSSTGSHGDTGQAVAVAGDGTTYVAGTGYHFASQDGWCLAYGNDGTPLWDTFYDGVVAGGDAFLYDLALSPTGLWATGVSATPADDDDLLMVKFAR